MSLNTREECALARSPTLLHVKKLIISSASPVAVVVGPPRLLSLVIVVDLLIMRSVTAREAVSIFVLA